jgi:hypothetical protein
MLYTPVHGVPLASSCGIIPLDYLGTSCLCQSGRIVGAIVRDHKEPVTRQQLTLNIRERRQQSRAFVMRWNQQNNRRPNAIIRTRRVYPSGQCCNNLEKKHGDGSREKACDDHQQAGD